MIQYTLLLAAVLQSVPVPQQQMSTPHRSPVARLVITPAERTITAGDTVRLRVQPLDSAGQPVPNVRILFRKIGAYFEGEVDSTGLVTAGSPGVMPVGIVALVEGTPPVTQRIELRMVPGPAARIELTPRDEAGARTAHSTRGRDVSASGDARRDDIVWRSSAPAVVLVNEADS